VHSLAGYLARTAANTSADVNINWHLIAPGNLAGRDLILRYLGIRISDICGKDIGSREMEGHEYHTSFYSIGRASIKR